MACLPKKGEVKLKDLKNALTRLENFVNDKNRPAIFIFNDRFNALDSEFIRCLDELKQKREPIGEYIKQYDKLITRFRKIEEDVIYKLIIPNHPEIVGQLMPSNEYEKSGYRSNFTPAYHKRFMNKNVKTKT